MLKDNLNGGIGVDVTPTPPINQEPVTPEVIETPSEPLPADTIDGGQLKEIVIDVPKKESQRVLDFRSSYQTKDQYIQSRLTPFARRMGNTEKNYPKSFDDDYDKKYKKDFAKHLSELNPKGDKRRGEWLDSLSDDEWDLVKDQPEYKSTIWQEFKQGASALTNRSLGRNPNDNVLKTANDIGSLGLSKYLRGQVSKDLSAREKKELADSYDKNGLLTDVGEIAKILAPLAIPGKLVQGALRDDYSIGDALAGKQNDADFIEEFATDPFNFSGFGVSKQVSKKALSKLDDVKGFIKPVSEAVTGNYTLNEINKTIDATNSSSELLRLKEFQKRFERFTENLNNSPEILKIRDELYPEDNINVRGYFKYDSDMFLNNLGDFSVSARRYKEALKNLEQFENDYKTFQKLSSENKIINDFRELNNSTSQGVKDVIDNMEGVGVKEGDKYLTGNRNLSRFEVTEDGTKLSLTKGSDNELAVLDKDNNLKSLADDEIDVHFNNDGSVSYSGGNRQEIEESVDNTINKLEEMFPGGKVIGSATLYKNHNMPDVPGDFDVTITKSDWDAIDKTGMNINKNPNNEFNSIVTIEKDGIRMEVDINVIDNAQPDERLSKEFSMLSDDLTNDPEGYFKSLDPTVKSMVDVFKSSKDKHITKPESLITFSNNQDQVLEAQELMARSLVGKNYQPLPKLEFGTFNENLELLDKIGFKGYASTVASDPKKMQNAMVQYYHDNTIMNRYIQDIGHIPGTQTPGEISAFTEWKPEMGGGSASGFGLNTVELGDSNHTYGAGLKGYIQVFGDYDNKTPNEIVDYIQNRYVDRVLTDEETIKVNNKLLELGLSTGSPKGGRISNYGEVINKEFTDWIADEFDIVSTRTIMDGKNYKTYGNSYYRGMIGNRSEGEYALKYARLEGMENVKSARIRKEYIEDKDISDIVRLVGHGGSDEYKLNKAVSSIDEIFKNAERFSRSYGEEISKYDKIAEGINEILNSPYNKDALNAVKEKLPINFLSDLDRELFIRSLDIQDEIGYGTKLSISNNRYEDAEDVKKTTMSAMDNFFNLNEHSKLFISGAEELINKQKSLSNLEKEVARMNARLEMIKSVKKYYHSKLNPATVGSNANNLINE